MNKANLKILLNQAERAKWYRETISQPYTVKYAVTRQERIALIETCGVNGLVCFEYYLRMCAIESKIVTDEMIAEYFGWTIHTAKRTRLKLISEGWIYLEKITFRNKISFWYYLGREIVDAHLTCTTTS